AGPHRRESRPHSTTRRTGAAGRQQWRKPWLKLLVAVVDRSHERMHVEAVHRVLVALVVFPVAELGLVALAFGQITQGHLLVLVLQERAARARVGGAISFAVGVVVVGPGDHALLEPGAGTGWVDPGVGREVVDGLDGGFRHARCLHHTPSAGYTTPRVAI